MSEQAIEISEALEVVLLLARSYLEVIEKSIQFYNIKNENSSIQTTRNYISIVEDFLINNFYM